MQYIGKKELIAMLEEVKNRMENLEIYDYPQRDYEQMKYRIDDINRIVDKLERYYSDFHI